jgi:hypothetical protein
MRTCLSEKGNQLCEYVVEYVLGYSFQSSPIATRYVKRPRLITANESVGPQARSGQRNSETGIPREGSARRNWHNDRYMGEGVKAVRRDQQHGTGPLLLVAQAWI